MVAACGLGVAGITGLLLGIFCGSRCSTKKAAPVKHEHAISEVVANDPRSREDDVLQAAVV